MISVPRGKDDLSLYRGIPSPLALAPWGFGQLLPAVSFSSCEFCNEQRNVLSVSLHPFIFSDLSGFDELLSDYLNGSLKSFFTELGMTKIQIYITWLKEYKCIDLQGRYNGNYVDIQIDEAGFEIAVDSDEPDIYDSYKLVSKNNVYSICGNYLKNF